MQTMTEIALEKAEQGLFTHPEAAIWVAGTPDRLHSLIKRALGAGEIVRLRRGFYCLADRYLKQKPNPFVLAQRIYGPSYISMESALSCHGWIPEATYGVTSTSMERSCEFETPLGRFGFVRVPQVTFYEEVSRAEDEAGNSFFLSTPLKALADYVYTHACDWSTSRPLRESLRIEESSLATITSSALERLAGNYASDRVRRFLEGLGKEAAP